MADQQQFFLKWNDYQSNMVTSFRHLRDEKSFTDVTLACEGQTCKAHKMVLSACSPYFKSLLEENPSKHPIIILKDVAYSHLQAILEFMYAGEVNVSQEQLPAFLKTADRLKVKGLAEAPPAIKREWNSRYTQHIHSPWYAFTYLNQHGGLYSISKQNSHSEISQTFL